jgi:pyruvate ferredoxin oxidoreductase gamma subunit
MTNLDIRMAGLGGQGVVTAAHILGTAVVDSGKYASVNPFFGAEKRLAPTESYVRIAKTPIYDRGEVLYPNSIMIFAPEVITMGKSYTMPFYSGLRENGLVIINSKEPILSDEEKEGLEKLGTTVFYFPATKLAKEFTGTDLATNMTMLGVLCGFVRLINLQAVITAMEERFSGKTKIVASGTTGALDEALRNQFDKASIMIEKNTTVIIKAYEQTCKWVKVNNASMIL